MNESLGPQLAPPTEADRQIRPVVIETALPGLILRQMVSTDDDQILFDTQQREKDRIAEFGNLIYPNVEEVTKFRESYSGMIFGIYKYGEFAGVEAFEIHDEDTAEVGTWVTEAAEGKGVASASRRALAEYLYPTFKHIYAETRTDNERAINSLLKSGFAHTYKVVSKPWGDAEIFNFVGK